MNSQRQNVYTCTECGGRVVTVDRDDGTTPASMACRVNGKPDRDRCPGMMWSSFYQVPPDAPDPTWEWFAPTEEELEAYLEDVDSRAHRGTREHVRMGGLLIRRIPAGTPHP